MLYLRARSVGVQSSALVITSNEKIVEVFSSYRESVVRNRRDYYAREIGKVRFALAEVLAEISFMPYISKYVIETSLVLGALLIGFVQFFLQDATNAVATLAVFLAAGLVVFFAAGLVAVLLAAAGLAWDSCATCLLSASMRSINTFTSLAEGTPSLFSERATRSSKMDSSLSHC